MANYPTAAYNPSAKSPGNTITAAFFNDPDAEIRAIELALVSSGLAHNLLFVDATYDIGASGATRPRDLFLSRNAVVGGTLAVTGVATFTAAPVFTAGVGNIAFPSTQVPSADVNTLDDYEEGSWTPVIGGAGGTSGQTYGAQGGVYIKIGKLVWASFNVELTAEGTITGSAQIQGLPFAVAGAGNGASVALQWSALATTWASIHVWLGNASTAVDIQGNAVAATSAFTALTATDIGNTTVLRGTLVYRTTA